MATMKIVHSFWSKPTFERGQYRGDDRKSGGWLEKKYNYMSWALSCLTFKKHYDFIELVTDSKGKSLLIDTLGLPYDNVVNELDKLNDFHTDLWATAKLFTYKIQDEPFMHVDSDVYIWKRLTDIEDAPLVAQNEETDIPVYKKMWADIVDNYEYVPDYMLTDFRQQTKILSCNAGIFGGTDVAFIKEFANESFHFLSRNRSCYDKITPLAGSVLIYEQYLFSCLARKRMKDVSYLFPSKGDNYVAISEFLGVPGKKFYVHAVGGMKKREQICQNVADQLLLQFPAYYYRIQELLNKHLI